MTNEGINVEPGMIAYNEMDNMVEELDDWLYETDRERWLDGQKLLSWKEWARGELKIGGQVDDSNET